MFINYKIIKCKKKLSIVHNKLKKKTIVHYKSKKKYTVYICICQNMFKIVGELIQLIIIPFHSLI
jgi:hypothetical protein